LPKVNAAVPAFVVSGCESSLRLCAGVPQALSGIFLGIGGGSPANRQYFVRAEQLIWDFAPEGQYMCDEVPRPFNDAEVSLHVRTAPLPQSALSVNEAHAGRCIAAKCIVKDEPTRLTPAT